MRVEITGACCGRLPRKRPSFLQRREIRKTPSASYKNSNPWDGGKRCFVGSFDYFDAIYAADVCCGGGRCRPSFTMVKRYLVTVYNSKMIP